MGDRGDVEHRVALDAAVVAEEFAVRAFGLDIAALVEIALDDVLGVGRHADVVGDAFHDRQRRVAQRWRRGRARRPARASSRRRSRSDGAPTTKLTGKRSPRASARFVDRAQIAAAPRDRSPVSRRPRSISRRMPTLVEPGRGSSDVIDRGRDVGRAVVAVLQMHRQRGQVDVVAGLTRPAAPARRRATTSTSSGLLAQPAQHLGQQLAAASRRKRARVARGCR